MARPWHLTVLSEQERDRRERLRRTADRDRFTVGVALTRLVLAGALSVEPWSLRLARRCSGCGGDHGKPRLDGPYDLGFSISHAGEVVVLAVAGGCEVGVDVERLSRIGDLGAVERTLLSADETGGPLTEAGLLRRWVRKEAVVKATGDGLTVPLSGLTVSSPGARARLLGWRSRARFPSEMVLRDLHPCGGYLACLAIWTPGFVTDVVTVRERDAGPVLTGEPGVARWP
jgi:4'-phosphopantetheinyl transferase